MSGDARSRRAALDAIWAERVGPPEPWLLVAEAAIEACVAWIDAASASASHAYMTAHAETLLSDESAVAFDEISLMAANDPVVAERRALRDECAEHGIDVVYRGLLIAETAATWRALTDLTESREFLEAHRDELLEPEAAQVLGDDAIGLALLALAASGRSDHGYALLTETGGRLDALVEARRAAPVGELHAVAMLCFATADDAGEQVRAGAHVGIALAISEQVEAATEIIRSIRGAGEAAALVRDVSDAIAHRPEHAVALAALLDALTEPEPDPAPDAADSAPDVDPEAGKDAPA